MKEGIKNILIAEPSYIIYEGISNILFKSGHQFRIYKIDELNEIPPMQLKTNIDVVLINPSFLQNQVKAFCAMKKEMNETKWLGIIYAHFDIQIINLLDGTVSVNDSPTEIINSIQKLLNTDLPAEVQQQSDALSEREIEVLKLLVSGNSNKEIADKLFISIHTVITHRKNISQKTGIKTVSGLTIYAVVNNIISLKQ